MKHYRKGSAQKGSAMMETVVSLFVLAIGLMGTLAMQARGVNSNQRANFATNANILAADMADRILAYSRSVNAATPIAELDLSAYNGIDTSDDVSEISCLDGCNLNEQKQFDAWEWSEAVTTSLPEGLGRVSFDNASNSYEIQVMWNHNRIENPTFECKGSTTDLACFVYTLNLE